MRKRIKASVGVQVRKNSPLVWGCHTSVRGKYTSRRCVAVFPPIFNELSGRTSDSECFLCSSLTATLPNCAIINTHPPRDFFFHGKKAMNPSTPCKKISPQMRLLERQQESQQSSGSQTPLRGSRFHLLPMISTPPLSHIKRVVNPFEASLTERLHLPAICSPSLFNRPSTPPHSSTQFEWTMEQVSLLNPATIEAHETQFLNSPNPDVEARAQAAISTYFREQHVVPSPIDPPMRQKPILYSEEQDSSIAPEPGKRNGIAQTVLTLPPRLPKDVEDALAPFFTFTSDQQQPPEEVYDQEKVDSSLRRKLFGPLEDSGDDEEEEDEVDAVVMPPPRQNWTNTPENWTKKFSGRSLDSPHDRSSFSPNLTIQRETFGSLSPIGKLSVTGEQQKARSSTSSIYQSTPERLGSELSVEMSPGVSTKAMDVSEVDEERMQMSQSDILAIHETPMRCRSMSRKNLSHSFSQIMDSEDGMEFFGRTDGARVEMKDVFTRTDSGFNDGSCDTMDNKENLDPMAMEGVSQDVSMMISSTPAKW
ncbi:protein aurora borealis [Phlebotomus argentipes]|uniref:protein aurora borealis n=1 Tax=Phlebotomus argentipes TaxID=94469 RepID=UPI00289335C3|nr:protein aurora borealis [Phlebotomus argentipes]